MPTKKPQARRKPRQGAKITATARVQIAAAAADGTQPRTFAMVAYTGEAMRIGYWGDPVVVDLETADLTAQRLPALYDHWPSLDSVVGQVEELAIENKQLIARGKFTVPKTANPEYPSYAERVLSLADAGYEWQASVGGDPATVEEIKAGSTGKANWGREYAGPCVIARGVKFREMSFVVLGGDRLTKVVTARHNLKGAAMTFEQWLLSMGFDDESALSEVQRTNLEIMYKEEYPDTETETESTATEGDSTTTAEMEDEEEPVTAAARRPRLRAGATDPVAADNARVAANRRRISEINALADTYGALTMKVNGRTVDIAAHAIEQGWDRNKTELTLLRASRPTGPHIHAPSTSSPLAGAHGPQVVEAAICAALRNPTLEKTYTPQVLEAAHKAFKGRISLKQVLLLAAQQNGYHAGPGEGIHSGNLRAVLEHAFLKIRAAGSSTVSLPGILSNVANKELLTGYMEEDQSWREVSAVKPVNDFKTVTSYRMLDNMAYEKVGADGKIKHGTTGEESYTRQAETFAKMFALTRRDIINDDLGAFSDLRNRLGRGAAQKFNDVFWTEFLDNAAFFTSGRGNYISGATTNLGADGVGLGLGVKAFRQMTSPTADGAKRIGGNPEILLHPPEVEGIAEALYVNTNPGQVATSSANIYANKYKPVTCAWLSDSSFTGYSTTAWYLLRNPAIMAAIVVSFLNGIETPTVEDSDADFDTLGIQFRGYHDFGCDKAEYLAGVKSKGAA